MPAHVTTVRATAAARAACGVALLLAPERILAWAGGAPVPPAAVTVARVLGARHLVQAGVTAFAPAGPIVGLGAVVDVMHASSDAALAAVAPRWRRAALIDACLAVGLAAAGWGGRRRSS